MLKTLRIRDFAIIDEMVLEFGKGLTVFTGETGAGKSILVDAIGLIIGGRATTDVVRDGSDEAVLEAIFEDIKDDELPEKMNRYGIASGKEEVLFRRNISKNGKNRVYINGILSTLSMLEDICSRLVDIHGQHEHQNLLRKDIHLEYLDAFGSLSNLKNRVKERYQYFNQLKERFKRLEEDLREKRDKEELFRYQLSEIKAAELKIGEDSELTLEKNLLSNSKILSALSDETYSLMYENDRSILSELSKIEENLAGISRIDTKMVEAEEMVKTSGVYLKEASELIRRFRDNLRYDPERLERIEERLYLIGGLKKKYGQTIEDIIACQSNLEKALSDMEHSDQDIKSVRDEIDLTSKEIEVDASELSKLRKVASGELEKDVLNELSLLQMEKTKFVVDIESIPLSQNGFDSVEFLIANLNEEPKPLARVASGGELSRIMLAIKSRLSAVDNVQTLIFDEIDAGIGGRVAEEVGRRLKDLSREHQVCCVTHLPQIAAMADTHYCVEKIFIDNRVTTRIKKLDDRERIEEISRMLGGKEKTKTALKYAEEMVRSGSR